jgi:hypothetical protein
MQGNLQHPNLEKKLIHTFTTTTIGGGAYWAGQALSLAPSLLSSNFKLVWILQLSHQKLEHCCSVLLNYVTLKLQLGNVNMCVIDRPSRTITISVVT